MTITANDARNEYTATASQTEFDYTFKIYASTDLKVYQVPSGETPNDTTHLITAYSVDGVGSEDGGTVTLDTGASAGDLVTIVSNIPKTRETDYQTNGDFVPDTVNDDFDRVVSLVKQLSARLDRSIVLTESKQGNSPLVFPTPSAGEALAWDATETELVNKTFQSGTVPANDSLDNDMLKADAKTGRLIQVDIYTASDTWTKPTGCTKAEVVVVGGGGGGGGCSATNAFAASAGGTGADKSYEFITTGLGATETVTVGAGGPGGVGNSNGTDGGDSSFGSHTVAKGGKGGVKGDGTVALTGFAVDATGTANAAGSTGDVINNGQLGGSGQVVDTGGNTLVAYGVGGIAGGGKYTYQGVLGYLIGNAYVANTAAGTDASDYGDGGDGCALTNNAAGALTEDGTAGEGGYVMVKSYY